MVETTPSTSSLIVPLASGEVLWSAGETVQPHRLVSGVLLYTHEPLVAGRNETPIALVVPGQIALPCPATLHQSTADYTVRALVPSRVQELDRVPQGEAVSSRKELVGAMGLLHAWHHQLSLEERLARLYLLLSQHGADERGWFRCKGDLQALACGVRRETLALLATPWIDAGFIDSRYDRRRVKDAGALLKLARMEAGDA